MEKVIREKFWTVFYTKPRHEKRSAERLQKSGYEVFMPLREELKQWSDRKKKVLEPLFKSYLFAKVNEKERLGILQDIGIVANVFWLKKPVVIRESEIEAIKFFLQDFPSANVRARTFSKQDLVAVSDGLLAGKKGVVREKRGRKYLIQIEQLDMEVIAEIHENFIIPTKS